MVNQQNNPVQFVGAGPGDPELLTVKGKNILERADLVIWAGSLIHEDVLSYIRSEAEILNSAELVLEETVKHIRSAVDNGQRVVRLHSGDASIYGALREELEALQKHDISCNIVPGVSSFTAAAAQLQAEYTIPEVAQSIILTRKEGRTPVPEGEDLKKLAEHETSMCLFLSSARIHQVVDDLLTSYDSETPVSVGHRVTWPDEEWVHGTLEDIVSKVRAAGMNKTSLILVGEFLEASGFRSNLYDPDFSHGYRNAQENLNKFTDG